MERTEAGYAIASQERICRDSYLQQKVQNLVAATNFEKNLNLEKLSEDLNAEEDYEATVTTTPEELRQLEKAGQQKYG